MKNHAHKSYIAGCNSEQLKSLTQDMMGFRECFSFRVSYRCELFGKQIWNLTGLRKSLAFRVHIHAFDSHHIGAIKTCQVWTRWHNVIVLRSEFFMYWNDSISIGAYETCQVWTRWHTAKVSHTRLWNLTGLRNSLAFRVLHVFKRFNQHRYR